MGAQGIVEQHACLLLQLYAWLLVKRKITKKAGKLMIQQRINGI
jgi:hypothetical protein